MLPTRPVKKPATGPNAKPKNGTSANAGRTSTAVVPGTGTLNSPTSTPYSAAPIAEYTMVRESTAHSELRFMVIAVILYPSKAVDSGQVKRCGGSLPPPHPGGELLGTEEPSGGPTHASVRPHQRGHPQVAAGP